MCSRWTRIILHLKLSSNWETVKLVYNDTRIPVFVRHYLADWIETQISVITPGEFLNGLQQKCSGIPEMFLTVESTNFMTSLETEYALNPELLQQRFKSCLEVEAEISMADQQGFRFPFLRYNQQIPSMDVSETTESTEPASGSCPLNFEETSKLSKLKDKTEAIWELLSKLDSLKPLRTEQDSATTFALLHNNDIFTFKQIETKLYTVIVGLLTELKMFVQGYLKPIVEFWKYEKKRSLIGYDNMSSNVTAIEDESRLLRKSLKDLETIVCHKEVWDRWGSSLMSHIWNLREDLVNMTVYIENAPLIRKGSKFSTRVGILAISDDEFASSETNVNLELQPLTQEGAEKFLGTTEPVAQLAKKVGVVSGNVFPNSKISNDVKGKRSCKKKSGDSIGSKKHFVVDFEDFTLGTAEKRREGSTQADFVTDQLVYIGVSGWIHFDDRDFQIRMLSIPHVLTTHNNQNSQAWSTILWNYGFCHNFYNTFQELPKVAEWNQILEVVTKFYELKTKLILTEPQLRHLTSKANVRKGNELVELKDFFKKTILEMPVPKPGKVEKYSYWRWLYAAVRIVELMRMEKCHEGLEWVSSMNTYFHGFICKTEAEELIKECERSTFLLRFSDSTPGGISVVVNIDQGKPRSVNPFTKAMLPLSDTIMKMVDAEYLYPDIPKEDVFEFTVPPPQEEPPAGQRSSGSGYVDLNSPLVVADPDHVLESNGLRDVFANMDTDD